MYVASGTTPAINFRGDVPSNLELSNVLVQTSGSATTFIDGAGGTIILDNVSFDSRNSTNALISIRIDELPVLEFRQQSAWRQDYFLSATSNVSVTTTMVNGISGTTITVPSANRFPNDKRITLLNRSVAGSATVDVAGGGTINGFCRRRNCRLDSFSRSPRIETRASGRSSADLRRSSGRSQMPAGHRVRGR